MNKIQKFLTILFLVFLLIAILTSGILIALYFIELKILDAIAQLFIFSVLILLASTIGICVQSDRENGRNDHGGEDE